MGSKEIKINKWDVAFRKQKHHLEKLVTRLVFIWVYFEFWLYQFCFIFLEIVHQFVGKWRGDASILIVGPDGSIKYEAPGMNIDGMGMSGWMDGRITGFVCCISKSFSIRKISENELEVDGSLHVKSLMEYTDRVSWHLLILETNLNETSSTDVLAHNVAICWNFTLCMLYLSTTTWWTRCTVDRSWEVEIVTVEYLIIFLFYADWYRSY